MDFGGWVPLEFIKSVCCTYLLQEVNTADSGPSLCRQVESGLTIFVSIINVLTLHGTGHYTTQLNGVKSRTLTKPVICSQKHVILRNNKLLMIMKHNDSLNPKTLGTFYITMDMYVFT